METLPDSPVCGHCGAIDLKRSGTHHGRKRYRCNVCHRSSYGKSLYEDWPQPESPVCTHCGHTALLHCGNAHGKLRYRCQQCQRTSYGIPAAPPTVRFPCPNPGCGGSCRKIGLTSLGEQRFHCPRCGRKNTALRRSRATGPFPHQRTFQLSLQAEQHLVAYCQRHKMSEIDAARHILRQLADEPVRAMAAGKLSGQALSPTPPREPIPDHLPDLRAATTGKRTRAGGSGHYSVLVTHSLSITMDDTAYQGLLRFMRKTGMNHQEALRYLIIHAV